MTIVVFRSSEREIRFQLRMSLQKKTTEDKSRYCPNCHYPLAKFGEHCSSCGQKFTDGRVPIWVFLHDLFEAIFNVDSKIFRTVFSLFSPGKLTNDYFKGRQKRYATPLRLFLILAVIHFAALSLITGEEDINLFDSDGDNEEKDAYYDLFLADFDTIKEDVYPLFRNQKSVIAAIDTLEVRLDALTQDSTTVGYLEKKPNQFNFDGKSIEMAKVDVYTKTPRELVDMYGIEGFWHRLQAQQVIRIKKDGKSFSGFVLGKLIWMVALMMPALAFTLKLLYIRRKKYFVEHLVFSFHYHAFAFLVFTLVFLGIKGFRLMGHEVVEDQIAISMVMALMGVMIYLLIAMRRVYKQNFFKTFVKYSALNFSYIFIFTLFLVLTLAVSILIF